MSGNVRMDRRLYLTADGSRAVPDGDPEAATLLCSAGGDVPYATAARYGLLKQSEPESEEKKAPEPAKAQEPPANKARTRAADK